MVWYQSVGIFVAIAANLLTIATFLVSGRKLGSRYIKKEISLNKDLYSTAVTVEQKTIALGHIIFWRQRSQAVLLARQTPELKFFWALNSIVFAVTATLMVFQVLIQTEVLSSRQEDYNRFVLIPFLIGMLITMQLQIRLIYWYRMFIRHYTFGHPTHYGYFGVNATIALSYKLDPETVRARSLDRAALALRRWPLYGFRHDQYMLDEDFFRRFQIEYKYEINKLARVYARMSLRKRIWAGLRGISLTGPKFSRHPTTSSLRKWQNELLGRTPYEKLRAKYVNWEKVEKLRPRRVRYSQAGLADAIRRAGIEITVEDD